MAVFLGALCFRRRPPFIDCVSFAREIRADPRSFAAAVEFRTQSFVWFYRATVTLVTQIDSPTLWCILGITKPTKRLSWGVDGAGFARGVAGPSVG